MVSARLLSMSSCSLMRELPSLPHQSELSVLAVENVWIPVFTGMTRNAKPRQLYFLSTSRAMTMRMTSDAPSVIMRLR
jgi:hypothetical protein